jgi:uncharacterized protein (TIGR00251 family)
MSENVSGDKKEGIKIIRRQNAVVFYVKVIPSSSRTSLEGVQNGMLRVKLSAAPERGKANKALIDFLSEKTGIKKKFIRIISGLTSKVKQIAAEQETAETLTEKLRIVR